MGLLRSVPPLWPMQIREDLMGPGETRRGSQDVSSTIATDKRPCPPQTHFPAAPIIALIVPLLPSAHPTCQFNSSNGGMCIVTKLPCWLAALLCGCCCNSNANGEGLPLTECFGRICNDCSVAAKCPAMAHWAQTSNCPRIGLLVTGALHGWGEGARRVGGEHGADWGGRNWIQMQWLVTGSYPICFTWLLPLFLSWHTSKETHRP